MTTKYILDPSGNIIKVENGEIEESVPANKSDYITQPEIVQNGLVNNDQISVSELNESDTFKILGLQSNDKSFNFVDDGPNVRDSFSPFNSFTQKEGDENAMPKAFADEFEILTGARFRENEFKDSAEVIGLLFTYLAESLVRALTVEGIVLANRAIGLVTNGSANQSRVAERYKLRLGKYDFTEFDVFTKYVFNVLNYPQDSSNIEERLSAYFLGFASWLAPDGIVDIENVIKEHSNSLNSIDFATQELPKGFLSLPASGIITSTVVATAQITVNALTNTTVVNRAKLLLRKFYQEKYWDSTQLYRAKEKNNFLDFFTDLNYYYFKFYIERVQIGLKLLNKYLYDDSYLKSRTIDSPLNRVSAARSIKSIDIPIKNPGTYNWNYKNSGRRNSQSTRVRALPQAFNMNHSFYRALALNGKDTLDIGDDLMQNFYKSDQRRLPAELVREIENHLESEYMPFYFHDLRTNEIISFHAFIESISDSFSPEYSSASGFGRIDDVKSYVKTTRNINLTFIVAATSEEDHDLMWFQVNKIVAMVYPQWSDAFPASRKDDQGNPIDASFKYPFTQVVNASPLIRLRVGDVIKSNYSRTNLSRLHGIGDRRKDDKLEFDPDLEQNTEQLKKSKEYSKELKKLNKNIDYQEMVKKNAIDDLEKNPSEDSNYYKYRVDAVKRTTATFEKNKNKIIKLENSITNNNNNKIRIYYLKPGLYRTQESSNIGSDLVGIGFSPVDQKSIRLDYEVKIEGQIKEDELKKDFVKVEIKLDNKKYLVVADISKIRIVNPDDLVGSANLSELRENVKSVMDPEVKTNNSGTTIDSINNPITRAYESGMSRGLAGFITNLDVNYNESTWDTGRIGSKAPMMVKINIGFSPIHDIPPGLDHNGMLRAPTYNVGKINNEFFGDPHDGAGRYSSNGSQSNQHSHGAGREAALQKYEMIFNRTNKKN